MDKIFVEGSHHLQKNVTQAVNSMIRGMASKFIGGQAEKGFDSLFGLLKPKTAGAQKDGKPDPVGVMAPGLFGMFNPMKSLRMQRGPGKIWPQHSKLHLATNEHSTGGANQTLAWVVLALTALREGLAVLQAGLVDCLQGRVCCSGKWAVRVLWQHRQCGRGWRRRRRDSRNTPFSARSGGGIRLI